MHNDGKSNVTINVVAQDKSSNKDINISVEDRNFVVSPSTVPFQPPSPPSSFVGRLDDIKIIKEHLLKNDNFERGLVVSALHGQGGIGKTTLAAFIAHNKEIRDHFSDGVLWITLGQEPKIISLLHGSIHHLDSSELLPSSEEDSSQILRRLLQEKSMFLVIDDAWKASDVKYFQVGGQKCRTLITTRDSLIANAVGATLHELDILDEEQALKLMINLLDKRITEDEKEKAKVIVEAVSYLPQAIELVAVQLKDGLPWDALIKDLKREVGRLKALEMPGVDELDEASQRKLSLDASISLSLRKLPAKKIRFFTWLGILPEDVIINPDMAATLWDISQREAFDNLRYLRHKALLMSNNSKYNSFPTFKLHDLILDKARDLITKPSENDILLPGLGLSLEDAHAAFLNNYQKKTQNLLWSTLKDDGYIHSHLTWHMNKAGWIEEIHDLLAKENAEKKNVWYETLESIGQSDVFIGDITRAWKLAEDKSESQIQIQEVISSIALETRYALLNTSINSLCTTIPEKLLCELLKNKKWTEGKALTYAQKEPDLHRRAIKLISILPEIKNELIKSEILEEAMDSAEKIEDEYQKVHSMSSIIPYLDKEEKDKFIEKILETIQKIKDQYQKADSLIYLSSFLDEQRKVETLEKAIYLAGEIPSENSMAYLLVSIYSLLEGPKKDELREKTLSYILRIKSQDIKTHAMSDIILDIESPEKYELIKATIDSVLKIRDPVLRADSISSIAGYMEIDEKDKCLREIIDSVKYQSDFNKIVILSSIIPILEEPTKHEVMKKAIEIISIIKDEELKTNKLSSIVIHFKGHKKDELLEKTLEVAYAIKNENLQIEALSSIILYLEGRKKDEVMEKALDSVAKIKDEDLIVSVLAYIIPYLKGQKKDRVLEKAFECVLKIKDDKVRAKALSSIVALLEDQQRDRLADSKYNITSEAKDEDLDMDTSSSRVTYLERWKNNELLEKALECAVKFEDEGLIVHAICSIFPHIGKLCKNELMEKALNSILNIQSEYRRVDALSFVVPYIEGPKKDELMEKSLDSISKIISEDLKVSGFSLIVPYLEGQKKYNVLENALNSISKIKSSYQKANSLLSVVPLLEGPKTDELIEKSLDFASTIEDEGLRAYALSSIVPYVKNSKKFELMEKILEYALEIEFEHHRAHTLSSIIPYLEGPKEDELIEKIFNSISKTQSENQRAHVLSSMLLYLEMRKKYEIMEMALEYVSNFRSEYQRMDALSSIISLLGEQRKNSVLEKMFVSASKIQCHRINALTSSIIFPKTKLLENEDTFGKSSPASRIENIDFRSKINVLNVSSSQKLFNFQKSGKLWDYFLFPDTEWIKWDPGPRKICLTYGLCYKDIDDLLALPTKDLYSRWKASIQIFTGNNRRDFLNNFGLLILVAYKLGGENTLLEISSAIEDASNWWP